MSAVYLYLAFPLLPIYCWLHLSGVYCVFNNKSRFEFSIERFHFVVVAGREGITWSVFRILLEYS